MQNFQKNFQWPFFLVKGLQLPVSILRYILCCIQSKNNNNNNETDVSFLTRVNEMYKMQKTTMYQIFNEEVMHDLSANEMGVEFL